MTPHEFKAARLALGLNQRQMAEALRVGGEAVIRSWESGRRPISGPAQVAVEIMLRLPTMKRLLLAACRTPKSFAAIDELFDGLAGIETGTAETVKQGSVPKG